jgi:hypothetical protein
MKNIARKGGSSLNYRASEGTPQAVLKTKPFTHEDSDAPEKYPSSSWQGTKLCQLIFIHGNHVS